MPSWYDSNGECCVVVIRLMNPDLRELGDFLSELLDRRTLPEGSILLAGAPSYLHRVGVSVYAREWVRLVGRLGRRIPNCRISPLPPIIREDCNGGVARDLIEFASWIARVYCGSQDGLLSCWNTLIPLTIQRCVV